MIYYILSFFVTIVILLSCIRMIKSEASTPFYCNFLKLLFSLVILYAIFMIIYSGIFELLSVSNTTIIHIKEIFIPQAIALLSLLYSLYRVWYH